VSSRFRYLVHALDRDVRSPLHRARFAEARSRHRVLARFADVDDVLAFMKLETAETYPERDALSRVAIDERLRGRHEFWSSLLAVAYYPMLSRLRFRIWGQPLPDEDLDQLVLMSFFAVVDGFKLERWTDRTAMRLRQHTSRAVFDEVIRVQKRRSAEPELRAEEPIDVEDYAALEVFDELERSSELDATAARLRARLRADMTINDLDLLVATVVYGRTIRQAMEAQLAGTGEDLERAYQRYKKRHSRGVWRLTRSLTDRSDPALTSLLALRGHQVPSPGQPEPRRDDGHEHPA
jgi:hypothetical protein